MAKGICSVEGCDEPVKAKTYCLSHYARAWRYGDAEYKRAPHERKACSVEGCEREVKTAGFCGAHYKRWHRHGDPLGGRKPPLPPYDGALCSIEGCDRPATKRTWCDAHYMHWRIYGNPHRSIMVRVTAPPRERKQKPPKPIATHDAAWLAGLFEGEGTIVIEHDKFVRLVISMTDRDVIEHVHELVPMPRGPRLKPRGEPHHKDQWVWYAKRAAIVQPVLLAILPWLGERRRVRALEALYVLAHKHPGTHGHFHKAKTHCPYGHPYDEENTYEPEEGRRSCRTCVRERGRRWEQRNIAERRAREAESAQVAELE